MLNLVIVNVGNSLRTRISIVVLTLIAWVTIVTSVQMVSYDLQSRRGIVGSRFLNINAFRVNRQTAFKVSHIMNVKYLQSLLLTLSFFGLVSCNQGKIDNLEYEVSKLEKENKALRLHVKELEEIISSYESYRVQYSNQQRQQQQREWHQQNAQQHLRTAEFWRQNGNEFLYESCMRQAQQELDMTP